MSLDFVADLDAGSGEEPFEASGEGARQVAVSPWRRINAS